MRTVKKHLKGLEIGEIQNYRNLAIAPILGDDGPLEHITLANALSGGFEITEKGAGSVPVLFAVNRTGKNVIAVAGEYVKGGRQNRTLMRNVYFDKNFEGDLPVRCVQQGRWGYGEREEPFISPPIVPPIPEVTPWNEMPSIEEAQPGSIPGRPGRPRIPRPGRPRERPEPVFRHAGHAPVAALYASSQGETWNCIDEALSVCSVESSSKDLHAVFTERSEDFEQYKDHFPMVEDQVGNIAVIGKKDRKVFVIDLFDRNSIFSEYHGNLVSSYALEAGLRSKKGLTVNEDEVSIFLESVNSCDFEAQQPVSVGKDYKISGGNLKGSALLFDSNLAYLNLVDRPTLNPNPQRPGTSPVNSNPWESPGTGFYRTLG